MDKYPMTPAGLKTLEAELKKIKEVDRPANVKAIEEARAHGDLSENAEYKYAKEQQSFIATRINYLEDRISSAEVIDPSKLSGDKVVFGAKVTLEDLERGTEKVYRIVGEDEADPSAGTLSYVSPVAQALMGKQVGDVVEAGAAEAEIAEIS